MYLQIIVQKYVALRTHRLLIPGKCILSGIIAFTLRKNTANFLNFQNEYFAHNSKNVGIPLHKDFLKKVHSICI